MHTTEKKGYEPIAQGLRSGPNDGEEPKNLELFPTMPHDGSLWAGRKEIPLVRFYTRNERPILRGSRKTYDHNSVTVLRELYCNGLVEVRYLVSKKLYVSLPDVLCIAVDGLLIADAFRKGVGAVDTEYAFELELRSKAEQFRLLEPRVDIPPNQWLFPRLSIGNAEEFGKIMRLVHNDLLNAAGRDGTEEEFTLEFKK